ncbi:uncharacterized protein LOC135479329 [Liolophura sinensis]|uniref:uncharacterized protein LOC135479329 n=1 Tax=Liolophura sinensis TaxID=3198878 RepID=UPI003158AA2C
MLSVLAAAEAIGNRARIMDAELLFTDFNPNVSAVNDSSGTGNATAMEENWVVGFSQSLDVTVIPVIVLVGFAGNLLSAVIFLQPSLRQTSCCIYLAARAIADIGFLTCIFVIWLPKVGTDVLLVTGICQLVVFLSYLTAFVSAWFVVWLTIENFYRICRPFRMHEFCTAKKAKLVISFTTTIGCGIYSLCLATNHIVDTNGTKECTWQNKYQTINKILSYADTVLTFLIPLVIIALTLLRTSWYIVSRCKKTKKVNSSSSRELQSRMTHLLFIVSFVFLLLSLPSYIIRLRLVVCSLVVGIADPSPQDFLLQRIFQNVYYATFAINFFIYFGYARMFRKKCLELCGLNGTFWTGQVTKYDVASQVDRVELDNLNTEEVGEI